MELVEITLEKAKVGRKLGLPSVSFVTGRWEIRFSKMLSEITGIYAGSKVTFSLDKSGNEFYISKTEKGDDVYQLTDGSCAVYNKSLFDYVLKTLGYDTCKTVKFLVAGNPVEVNGTKYFCLLNPVKI
jgi:hypothetical protein